MAVYAATLKDAANNQILPRSRAKLIYTGNTGTSSVEYALSRCVKGTNAYPYTLTWNGNRLLFNANGSLVSPIPNLQLGSRIFSGADGNVTVDMTVTNDADIGYRSSVILPNSSLNASGTIASNYAYRNCIAFVLM